MSLDEKKYNKKSDKNRIIYVYKNCFLLLVFMFEN